MGQKMSDLKGGVENKNGARASNEEDNNGNHLEGVTFEENGNNNGDGISSFLAVVPSSSSMVSCTPSTSSERKKQVSNGSGRSKERSSGKKKRSHWVLSFNCARIKSNSGSSATSSEADFDEPNVGLELCTDLWRPGGDHHLATGVVFQTRPPFDGAEGGGSGEDMASGGSESGLGPEEVAAIHEIIDLNQLNLRQDEYTLDDCDERARLERAREIAEGVEPPPGFRPGQHIKLLWVPDMNIDSLTALIQSAALSALSQLESQRVVHTQVDYIHCLVPDLLQIACCSFYWGKMDRYEAERLLEGKPEGTFLLRDSAQEEYLFSVSFRKYDRSLHARIEQWKHLFSFDSHDPGVFSSPTVCGLLEHYKDPSVCMFFEPMLTIPLHRNFPFPLQHLARAVICSKISYDGISQLKLPKSLKSYLKEYHYKQRVKVTHFENE